MVFILNWTDDVKNRWQWNSSPPVKTFSELVVSIYFNGCCYHGPLLIIIAIISFNVYLFIFLIRSFSFYLILPYPYVAFIFFSCPPSKFNMPLLTTTFLYKSRHACQNWKGDDCTLRLLPWRLKFSWITNSIVPFSCNSSYPGPVDYLFNAVRNYSSALRPSCFKFVFSSSPFFLTLSLFLSRLLALWKPS